MKARRWIFGVSFGLTAVVTVACAWNAAAPPAADSESARLLASGQHRVATFDTVFVDASRPTDANGDFAGSPERTLAATLWYPEGARSRAPASRLQPRLHVDAQRERAARGAAREPRLRGGRGRLPAHEFPRPGGPNVRDAVNQPDDVRFVIDRVLAWGPGERPFAGEIDRERIGAIGLSLGGLTTTLAAFHPWLRDPRIAAAVSIAGPAAMFSPAFFATADVPFS
jgi:hypothetical protein